MSVMVKDDRQQPTRSTVIGKVVVPLLFPLREFLTCCPELQNCLSLDKILSKELHILSWRDRRRLIKTHEQLLLFLGEGQAAFQAKQLSRLRNLLFNCYLTSIPDILNVKFFKIT